MVIEGGSRQHELCKSKILLRCWSHTWQKKNTKKKQNSDTPNPQPIQSFSTPCDTEKTGGSRTADTGSRPAWETQTNRPGKETASNGMMGR
jgi:hypothetical protein